MSLWKRKINSSDIELVRSADAYADPREPELQIGNFVKLNSGGPVMMVVDKEGPPLFAWRDHAGRVYERAFPVACVYRVSPASAGNADRDGLQKV